jgi:hypothetical protein
MIGVVNRKFVLAFLLMLVFAASRWPGMLPDYFSAAYAIMFCAGLYFPGVWAWVLPLATMMICDVLLDIFAYHISPGWDAVLFMAPNYVAYALVVALGRGLSKGKRSFATLLGGGLIGAFVFYFVTNTMSWLTYPYAKTIVGWIQALTTGLPGFPPTWAFFRGTMLSGGIFTALFVGAIKLLQSSESPQEKRDAAPVKSAEKEEEPEPEAEPEPAHEGGKS